MDSLADRLDSLALHVKPILRPAERMGVAENIIDMYVSATDRYSHLDKVDDAIAEFELQPEDKEGEVLIPMLHAESWHANVLLLPLAHAFRTRGYEPRILVCYKTLPLCTKKQFKSDDVSTCAICHHETKAWLDAFGLESIYLDDILPDDYEPTYPEGLMSSERHHRGVNVLKFGKSTARKFLRTYRIDYSDEGERDIVRRFTGAAIELVDATHALLDTYDIDALVGHHSGYLYGGTILATGLERGVPSHAVSTFLAHREGVVTVNNMRNRHTLPPYAAREVLEERIKTPLTDAERSDLHEYLTGRRDGETIPETKHFTEGSHASIDVAEGKTHVGLFSNLMWDASLIDSHDVFNSPFSWVMATIDHLALREDIVLTIKPHPAEAVRYSNDKMADWIRRNIDPIPENVTVLEPDTEVSPYQMIQNLDVGLVYNSTLGIEMVYDGVPTVVAGDAHYRGFGFTEDPNTPGEYVDILESAERLDVSEEQRRRCERYAHYFFIQRPVPFPQFRDIPDMGEVCHDELGPGNDALDHLVERIIADDRAISYPQHEWGKTSP